MTGEYYHVFNRGVARQPTFISTSNYKQAILALNYYRYLKPPVKLSKFKKLSLAERQKILNQKIMAGENLVDIVSFVLMPNHFHFLLRQAVDGGISKYISQFTNSYTRYFNTKNNRPGPVFQGVFKAVHVETGEQLLHLSRYIHLNPYVSSVIKKEKLDTYLWSSLPQYLKGGSPELETKIILSQFTKVFSYREFVFNHSDYARELEIVKHLILDIE